MSYTILIVDDETDICEILSFNIENAGYKTITANNGKQAIEICRNQKIDLILMDVMMPEINGIEACKIIKTSLLYFPIIIFHSAKNEEEAQLEAFESGADDYVCKPISIKVLIEKIKIALKKYTQNIQHTEESFKIGDLVINKTNFNVEKNEEIITLAKKEFHLLELLSSKPLKVFTRIEILENVWGNDVIVGDRTIDVHIRKIREKLNGDYIKTVKGVGYKFNI